MQLFGSFLCFCVSDKSPFVIPQSTQRATGFMNGNRAGAVNPGGFGASGFMNSNSNGRFGGAGDDGDEVGLDEGDGARGETSQSDQRERDRPRPGGLALRAALWLGGLTVVVRRQRGGVVLGLLKRGGEAG